MFSKLINLIKEFMSFSVQKDLKKDFVESVYKVNLDRAKIIAIAFVVLESIQIALSYIIKGADFFKKPNIFYVALYGAILLVMILFYIIFIKLEKKVAENLIKIQIAGISFITIILLWSMGISLLDQLSSGQIIIYIAAVVLIAITPSYKPGTLLLVYLPVHILFLILIPLFQKSGDLLLSNYFNSTTILIIAWSTSNMRYRKQLEDFNNKKIIKEKSRELNRVNLELKEANQKLERISQTDSLTGIYNRLVFDRDIEAKWESCKKDSVALSLILVDIDFFKEYNDNYGHQAGDTCLKQVTETMSNCIKRSSDIVARYGGEEFAVILPDMVEADALELAEIMRKKIEELNISHLFSSACKYVTISLGVHSVIPSDEMSMEKFIKITDNALFKAKKENRNRVAVL